jgi:excisionase family DNA binding protein
MSRLENEARPSSADAERAGPLKILLSKRECAGATGLSVRTIDHYIATGELRSVKIGKSRRVSLDSLRAFCRRDHVSPARRKDPKP